ncbi:hypothetical protein GCM10022221_31220 [Actinocorallia aurea]
MLSTHDLTIAYGRTTAVDRVSFTLPDTPTGTALIGESGSGKSTIARALLGLVKPASGEVRHRGEDLRRLDREGRRRYRADVQPVFQDGSEALDPRMRVRRALGEALRLRRPDAPEATVESLLADVGLDAAIAERRPHEMSGGQRQRVVIARALAVAPRLLVLDEPTSALDVTVQKAVLDLLARLKDEHGLSLLLITHDLAIIDHLCTDVHVLSAGRIVESGPVTQVFTDPADPYTRALLDAVPTL